MAYKGSGGIPPLILNLDTWSKWVTSLMSRPLHPWGKDCRYRCTRGWVSLRASLGRLENRRSSFPCRESNPGLYIPYSPMLQGHYNFPSWSGHSGNTYEVFFLHPELLILLNESIKLNLKYILHIFSLYFCCGLYTFILIFNIII